MKWFLSALRAGQNDPTGKVPDEDTQES